jgi:hypothetical protein
MDAITQPSAGTVELLKRRCCRVGHGNRYTAIYPPLPEEDIDSREF